LFKTFTITISRKWFHCAIVIVRGEERTHPLNDHHSADERVQTSVLKKNEKDAKGEDRNATPRIKGDNKEEDADEFEEGTDEEGVEDEDTNEEGTDEEGIITRQPGQIGLMCFACRFVVYKRIRISFKII
jgi:hypothetical protein